MLNIPVAQVDFQVIVRASPRATLLFYSANTDTKQNTDPSQLSKYLPVEI